MLGVFFYRYIRHSLLLRKKFTNTKIIPDSPRIPQFSTYSRRLLFVSISNIHKAEYVRISKPSLTIFRSRELCAPKFYYIFFSSATILRHSERTRTWHLLPHHPLIPVPFTAEHSRARPGP